MERIANGAYMDLMHKTIHKLINELIAKEVKEKSFEEKVTKKNEEMQLILYYLQLKSLVVYPTPPNTNEDHDNDT
ncbi:hypothetical protein CR513_28538, partial [Mucuna pruriens]